MIMLWVDLSFISLLQHCFWKYLKLDELPIIMLLKIVENEWCFSFLYFQIQIDHSFVNLVVHMHY